MVLPLLINSAALGTIEFFTKAWSAQMFIGYKTMIPSLYTFAQSRKTFIAPAYRCWWRSDFSFFIVDYKTVD